MRTCDFCRRAEAAATTPDGGIGCCAACAAGPALALVQQALGADGAAAARGTKFPGEPALEMSRADILAYQRLHGRPRPRGAWRPAVSAEAAKRAVALRSERREQQETMAGARQAIRDAGLELSLSPGGAEFDFERRKVVRTPAAQLAAGMGLSLSVTPTPDAPGPAGRRPSATPAAAAAEARQAIRDAGLRSYADDEDED